MELTSRAFGAGQPVPRRHSCEGEDLSPPLEWTGVPADAVSLALIVDDPDAPVGTFTHWLAWGISPEDGGIAEGRRAPCEGRNDFREIRDKVLTPFYRIRFSLANGDHGLSLLSQAKLPGLFNFPDTLP